MQIDVSPLLRLTTPSAAGEFVDELPREQVGELVVFRGHDVVGGLFVECGRICWIAAKGRGRHLSDLLAAAAGVEPSALKRHYDRCRTAKVPLGEDLVARGIVTPDALRSALLLHSAECLDLLCASDAVAQWQPRRRGYRSDFTFSTTELLARTHALRWPTVAAEAGSFLHAHFRAEAGDWGAAFLGVREGRAPFSIAVLGAFPEKAFELANVAQVSAAALEARSSVQPGPVTFTVDGDRTRCAFFHDDCMYVGDLGKGRERRILELRHDRHVVEDRIGHR